MATLNDLVETIAAVEGLERPKVALLARKLREDGLISMRGRGLSAAKMEVADAANLLIAANTSRYASEASYNLMVYRGLVAVELLANPTFAGGRIYGPLGATIESLIQAAGNDNLPETFMGKAVPQKLREEFPRGYVQVDLKFRTSTPLASLRMTALANPDSVLRLMAEEMIDVPPEWTLSFVFVPRGPPSRGPDRREDTTIGYRTLSAIGKLIR